MLRSLCALVVALFFFPVAATAQSEVQLAWDPVGDAGVVGYIIEYGTSSGHYSSRIDVGPNTDAVVTGLQSNVPYFFVVRSYNGGGEQSLPSNEVSHNAKLSLPPTPSVPKMNGAWKMIWRHSSNGAVAQWSMVGLTQVSGEAVGSAPVGDLKWKIAGMGDFNNDSHRDLVWQHSDTGHIAVWLMQGAKLMDGRLMNPGRVETKWRLAAVADMNGDKKSDLIWQNELDGHLALWLMDGYNLTDGHLLQPGRVEDLDWKIAGAGDFNGDRKADLLWRHKKSGLAAIWYMNGDRQVSGQAVETVVPDLNWTIVAVTDVNADGKGDIIWQHSTGKLAAWVMNGHRVSQGSELSPGSVADTKWKIVTGK